MTKNNKQVPDIKNHSVKNNLSANGVGCRRGGKVGRRGTLKCGRCRQLKKKVRISFLKDLIKVPQRK